MTFIHKDLIVNTTEMEHIIYLSLLRVIVKCFPVFLKVTS
jgi:hypothetical protein